MIRVTWFELLTPKFVLLYLYLAAVAYVHLRGRERLPFGRHAFFAPYNVLMYAFSKVPIRPFVDVSALPEVGPLRDNWRVIRDEALAVYENGNVPTSGECTDAFFAALLKRGWSRFQLKWYGDSLPSARQLCPRTVELIESIPEIRAAAFTIVPPGGVIDRHRDPLASCIRYHLGLSTPNSDDCRILVDGQPYAWRDGEDVAFDETYVHWVRNDTDCTRIILFCDVARPLHTALMRGLNGWVGDHLVSQTASSNRAGERTGALNRVAPLAWAAKRRRKRFKREHRYLYHGLKLTVLAGLAYLLFLRGLV